MPNKSMNDITIIETELTVPRKGSVKVRIDLKNKILSWRESNRWNRNFVRTTNKREIDLVREGFAQKKLIDMPSYYPNKETCLDNRLTVPSWRLSIYKKGVEPDRVWFGVGVPPHRMDLWIDLLSLVCRQPFDVID